MTINRRVMALGLLAAIVISVFAVRGEVTARDAHADSNQRFGGFICNPSGTWVGNSASGNPEAPPLTYTEQFSPIDLRTMNYRIEFKNVDATWAHPLLAETDTWIGMEGTARIGRSDRDSEGRRIRKWDVSAIGYGIKEADDARGEIQHITTMIGAMWTDGCNAKDAATVLRVYDYTADEDSDGVPDVDKNLDGIPDEDAVPIIQAPPPEAPIEAIPFPASKRVRLGLPN